MKVLFSRSAILYVVLLSALLTSCGIFTPAKTPEELLAGTTSKTWTMTKFLDDTGKDITSDFISYNMTFEKSGSYSERGQEKGKSVETYTGTWTINTSATPKTIRITYSGVGSIRVNYTVQELTETGLVLAFDGTKGVITLKSN